MGKPFRITGPASAVTNIGRAPNGKFVRVEAPTNAQLMRMAQDEGESIEDVLQRERTADHDEPSAPKTTPEHGTVHEANTIPWPPAGPINDANRPPMRLKR